MNNLTSSAPPLLTIMVATRNRMNTAVPTIASLLMLPDQDLEVFVQDCSDEPELGALLETKFDDPRLRYQYSEPPLSMIANWNMAIPELRGDYVCIIGDDDGVSSDIMTVVRWASNSGIDAVSPLIAAEYNWPDYPVAPDAACLIVRDFSGSLEFPDIEAELAAASHGFGQHTLRLPRLYQGIVRRSHICTLGERTGTFFDGIAPDFYIAFALASVVQRYCLVDYPLVVTGRSARSNSGRSRIPGTSDREMLRSHMEELAGTEWPEMLPSSLNCYTILTQSMLAALHNIGRQPFIKNIDLPLLFASTAAQELPKTVRLGRQLAAALKALGRPVLRGLCRFTFYLLARLIQPFVVEIKERIWVATRGECRMKGVNDIGEAVRLLDEEIRRRGKTFTGNILNDVDPATISVHAQ